MRRSGAVSRSTLGQRLLRGLLNAPYFPGRDRLSAALVDRQRARPVRMPDGLLLHIDCSEWVQADLFARGGLEPETLARMARIVRPGDCVVDVGAHIGYHAVRAALLCGPAGRVVAIDPQPYNADRIARNALANGLSNVITVCAAVSSGAGFLALPLQDDSDRSRLSLAGDGPGYDACRIEVPLRRLDEVLDRHAAGRLRLVKIDVEGMELDVIRSLGARLADCENIILEMLPGMSGADREQLAGELISAGFELFDVAGRPWREAEPLVENNCWATRCGGETPGNVGPGNVR